MPRVSEIGLFKLSQQPTLSIRTRSAVQDLPRVIGESYGKIIEHLRSMDEFVSDIPFVAYLNMDMQDLDVEIGFPVAGPLPGGDEVRSSTLPGGLAIACLYRGPYRDMAPTYDEMIRWIQAAGFIPTGFAYESYYNGPEFSESELLTKITMPVTTK